MEKSRGSAKPGKATLADVARRAGVSPATVARVLHANGYVSKRNRARVEAAIVDVGYRPNMAARALRTKRSYTIGMVVSQSHLNAFHPHVAHEVQIEALKHGYTVLSINNKTGDEVERQGVQRFLDQHVDAVIFCSATSPDTVHLVEQSGVPSVQIEREVAIGGSLVLADPLPGMEEAVRHLQSLGHNRIAYMGGDFNIGQSERQREESVEAQRLAAFRQAMAGAGLVVDDGLVRLGRYYVGGEELPGHRHMVELLKGDRPTAVIAGADLLAAGAIQAIREAGLDVPRDISVVGYDNIIAELLTPPLTSISQPIVQFGQAAVALALEAITEPGKPRETRTFPTRLVLRQSTAAVRR